MDEATTLTVRAANGTASSSLSASLNAGHNILGGGGAAALGLGIGGGNAKLSIERKYRMRELATRKLSEAYHLDEIAASVATMQSASSLEDVARLVLQRNPRDSPSRYVHFFHEKIPSRTLAESTSLEPLSFMVEEQPGDAALLRTRALTKIFKEDLVGSAKDLNQSLAIFRHNASQHAQDTADSMLPYPMSNEQAKKSQRDPKHDTPKITDEDKPTGFQAQILFQRAGVYLTIACQSINQALIALEPQETQGNHASSSAAQLQPLEEVHQNPLSISDTCDVILEARKRVRAYAKRALKDYLAFLSHLEYTTGILNRSQEGESVPNIAELSVNSLESQHADFVAGPVDSSGMKQIIGQNTYPGLGMAVPENAQSAVMKMQRPSDPSSNLPEVHQVSSLFCPSLPGNVASYISTSSAVVSGNGFGKDVQASLKVFAPGEAVTYHPLLSEALHGLLLCHSLMQTSTKEHKRHAHMVARLVRLSDGFPIFLAARSASRADWTEIMRKTGDWLGLEQAWEKLCSSMRTDEGTRRDGPKMQNTVKALPKVPASEKTQGGGGISQKAVTLKNANSEGSSSSPHTKSGTRQRWDHTDIKAYSLGTERADLIVRWIQEAPGMIENAGGAKKGRRKNPKDMLPVATSDYMAKS